MPKKQTKLATQPESIASDKMPMREKFWTDISAAADVPVTRSTANQTSGRDEPRRTIQANPRLANLEDRVEALERVNIERGKGKPPTKQARAINFIVANQALLAEMIEKYKAKA
jgi:hypothetical protein